LRDSALGQIDVFGIEFDAEKLAASLFGDDARRPGAGERVEYDPALVAAGQDDTGGDICE
jgi:hypothetical protein